MKIRLVVFWLFTLVLLSGCKIVIKVPANGEVVSQSGMHNCAAGKTCIVSVVDLFFDDRFTAKGAEGFKFKHWKKRSRGFCGGSKAPCHLYTSLLAGNASAMALLDSGERFYLEPVFESSSIDDGPVSKQNLSVCFNRDLLTAGSNFDVRYRSESKIDGKATIVDVEQTNMGSANFKGKQASLARSEITVSSGGRTVVSRSDSYFKAQIAARRSTNLGGTGETFVDGVASGSEELEFIPGLLTRYDLAAGESYTQTYTTNTTTFLGGAPLADSRTQDMTVTYIGVVTITIDAGTYEACKLEEEISGTFQGVPFSTFRTYWWGVGIGLQLKEDGEAATTELVSGAIDGAPI